MSLPRRRPRPAGMDFELTRRRLSYTPPLLSCFLLRCSLFLATTRSPDRCPSDQSYPPVRPPSPIRTRTRLSLSLPLLPPLNQSPTHSPPNPSNPVRSLIEAGASPLVPNKYGDTPTDLLSAFKPEDAEVLALLKEESGREELFGDGDLVGEDDLAGEILVRFGLRGVWERRGLNFFFCLSRCVCRGGRGCSQRATRGATRIRLRSSSRPERRSMAPKAKRSPQEEGARAHT